MNTQVKNIKNAPFVIVAFAICIITGLFGRGIHLLCFSEDQQILNSLFDR